MNGTLTLHWKAFVTIGLIIPSGGFSLWHCPGPPLRVMTGKGPWLWLSSDFLFQQVRLLFCKDNLRNWALEGRNLIAVDGRKNNPPTWNPSLGNLSLKSELSNYIIIFILLIGNLLQCLKYCNIPKMKMARTFIVHWDTLAYEGISGRFDLC